VTSVSDPTERFTGRADHYARHRPRYPAALLEVLAAEAVLAPLDVVADVGAGTGILAELLLRHGNAVVAVEPNASMRAGLVPLQRAWPSLRVTGGSAEATQLPDACVDVVMAGQAFHWFDPVRSKREFARILRPGGRIALVWNVRDRTSTPFLRGYESMLDRHAAEYARLKPGPINLPALQEFFAPGGFEARSLPHHTSYDLPGLQGLLRSTSYAPQPGEPAHDAMLVELGRLFAANANDGTVTMQYQTLLFFSAQAGQGTR
jgi:SAM-dependent methyltransferase